LMPAPIYYSHRMMERFAQLRHSGAYPFLRPDAKAQLSFIYEGHVPVAVKSIVLSHQHDESMEPERLASLAREVAAEVIPARFLGEGVEYYVNPTGRFVLGGPAGDVGLTGRKIIVDTYGGMGRHGGGCFSGKDPSKVDRSAAYMCRYVAKNIVAAGLASRCEIQVAYAIGIARPLSINVNFFGTGVITEQKMAEILMEGSLFDFRPAEIIRKLELKKPEGWCYRDTAKYGHFGKGLFPWERTDSAAMLKDLCR